MRDDQRSALRYSEHFDFRPRTIYRRRGVVYRDMIDVLLRIEHVRELAFVLNMAQGSAAAIGVLYVCVYII